MQLLDDQQLHAAEQLAQTLRLPLTRVPQPQGFLFALYLAPTRLELRALNQPKLGPVYADLCDGDQLRRIQGGRKQALARACGLHRDGPQSVLDATAGLGRDGTTLAGLGCRVTLCERSPVIAALLDDGLRRACEHPVLSSWIKDRLQMLKVDSTQYLADMHSSRHEVVYLDPMYPHRHKSALAKKEMRILREVAGADEDSADLLQLALRHALHRVVVKRPPWADSIQGPRPDHQIEGNRARYDVYFTRK